MKPYPFLHNRSGFFSDYYLGTVFGKGILRKQNRGFTNSEADVRLGRLGRLYIRCATRELTGEAFVSQFVRPVLRDVFDYHIGAGEERIHSLYTDAEAAQSGKPPLLFCYIGERDQSLDEPEDGRRKKTPLFHLQDRLAESGAKYGLLITGDVLRLVRAPGEGSRKACLEFDMAGCVEQETDEARNSFMAAYRLLSSGTFSLGPDGISLIEAIEKDSRVHADRVSDDLKGAVFHAAETLVQALLDDWSDSVPPDERRNPLSLSTDRLQEFRDAALTGLYRLLFILYAEARDPRLQEHSLYQKSYSLGQLVEELTEAANGPIQGNRHGIWLRLLALFEIYDKGLPKAARWDHIPPRGGDFFSSETPAGRILREAVLDDATVTQVLLGLTTTNPRRGVGRERISFGELGIEQLGSVYEGLLEYEPRIASEACFELKVGGRILALVPNEILRLVQARKLSLEASDPECVTGTPLEMLCREEEEAEEEEVPPEEDEEPAEGEEEQEEEQPPGGRAIILRRIEAGRFHFVPSSARKGSGTFYTPKLLVEDIVRHTLGPLVSGKRSAEIEKIYVLDPACGSGHFLVEACRFLGKALYDAYMKEGSGKPPPVFTGTKDDWGREIAPGLTEGLAWCKRRVAEKCLYGVDLNPTAIHLAHVALWIESLAGDRPLSYFEHHVRCGNSLISTRIENLGKPPVPKLLPGKRKAPAQTELLPASGVRDMVREAARRRGLIDEVPTEEVPLESVEEITYKENRRREAVEAVRSAKLLFDLRSASVFGLAQIWADWPKLLEHSGNPTELETYIRNRTWSRDFEDVRQKERFFHWELEFPEIFLKENPGFDVIIGNPPWDKVLPDRKEFYGRYDVLIRAYIGRALDQRIFELEAANINLHGQYIKYKNAIKEFLRYLKQSEEYEYQDWEIDEETTGGHQDKFKVFLERAFQLACKQGVVGLVIPGAIYTNEGCTGLRQLLLNDCTITRFYGFENRQKVFPIDSRYKFVSLVFQKEKARIDGFQTALMRRDLGELASEGPKPWMVQMTKAEIEHLSPGTHTFPEYRNPMDREIFFKMCERHPMLIGENGWGTIFYSEFNLTNDKNLWTDPETHHLFSVASILGRIPANFADTRTRMAEKGFWPLYQDAHIHQHVLEFKPFMRWVSLEIHMQQYGKLPSDRHKLVLRDRGTSTHERMCIASVLPPKSCFGHSLNGIATPDIYLDRLCAIINSLSFDFAARLKNGGLHVSPYLLKSCPIPRPEDVADLPIIKPIHANETETWIYEREEYWPLLWTIERQVAEAYGLTPYDFEHILGTFPGFASKRPRFYAYLRERLAEWKLESLEGTIPAPTEISVLGGAAREGDLTEPSSLENPAAVFAFVVAELDRPDLGRIAHDKMLYFVQEACDVNLGLGFARAAAGPWNPDLKFKVEPLAAERGWMTVEESGEEGPQVKYGKGPLLGEAIAKAKVRIGKNIPRINRLINRMKELNSLEIERWATIHKSWKDLGKAGKGRSRDAVLQDVAEWKGDRPGFERERLLRSIAQMLVFGLIELDPDSSAGGA